eukprot:CAMPEP_0114225908 /NCGR_PEP_ID=MMETSP0058-20121206/943_1 /TAXON_ID=36894 /ORGANISM="Pyramimonas parkeae, CCMP726" /LENGTH=210 /DNA_ID=CAMNT_0001336585 /DNA_START=398 /DNA_END=1027 /DNA_ORIENTATION=-
MAHRLLPLGLPVHAVCQQPQRWVDAAPTRLVQHGRNLPGQAGPGGPASQVARRGPEKRRGVQRCRASGCKGASTVPLHGDRLRRAHGWSGGAWPSGAPPKQRHAGIPTFDHARLWGRLVRDSVQMMPLRLAPSHTLTSWGTKPAGLARRFGPCRSPSSLAGSSSIGRPRPSMSERGWRVTIRRWRSVPVPAGWDAAAATLRRARQVLELL